MTADAEAQDGAFTRERLEGMLKTVYDLGRAKSRAEESYEAVRKPFSYWFKDHSEETLLDRETEIEALLVGGGDEHLLDFPTLLRDEARAADVLRDLAERGLLRLDFAGFVRQETAMQHGNTVRRFIYEVPKTRRLMIRRRKD